MEFELIKDVIIPEISNRGKYSTVVDNWLKTDNKTLKLICKNKSEKGNCASAIRIYAKKNHYDFTMYYERGTNNIYLVRA